VVNSIKNYKGFSMENEKKSSVFTKVIALGTVAVVGATNAMAEGGVLTAPTFALDDVATVAGALLVGLAGFWAIRKGLGLAR
jgi:hypothetical protein